MERILHRNLNYTTKMTSLFSCGLIIVSNLKIKSDVFSDRGGLILSVIWNKIKSFPTEDQIQKMSTKRLLTLKKKRFSHPYNDDNFYRLLGWFDEKDLLKEKRNYRKAYYAIKSELARRENVAKP